MTHVLMLGQHRKVSQFMKAVCHWCEAVFGNVQGLRAHLRWCEPYRISQGVVPNNRHADANPVLPPRVSSQRQRAEWVQTCDRLRKLLALAAGHTRIAKLMNFRYEQEELWRELFYELHQLLDLTWNMVSGVQPVISPNELYARLCSAQEQWMDYRAAHCPEENIGSIVGEENPSNGHMADEVELFERLMGHVKELMAITPA